MTTEDLRLFPFVSALVRLEQGASLGFSSLEKQTREEGATLTAFPARAAPSSPSHKLNLFLLSTQLIFLPLPFPTFWDVPCFSSRLVSQLPHSMGIV